ncbi:MAG: AAA family ATPase [Flavobacteriia bacterium]|nr:AAA family ATPase [Flavobacteriia bacterium]
MNTSNDSELLPSDQLRILTEKIQLESVLIQQVKNEFKKIIIGQDHLQEMLLLALLSNGHILLEGVPGLAKTLSIKTLSDVIGASFNRIQFTPDLLPADITGTMIYSPKSEQFQCKKGPLFAHLILADEINRAPAKVQSALLEAMQEKQVTIGEESYPLPNPFLVMATQNPIEQEGTYVLPEAQVDRFMFKVILDYPSKEEEKWIIRNNVQKEGLPKVNKIINVEDILRFRSLVKEVYMDEKIEQYIVNLVYATRKPEELQLNSIKNWIAHPCSPRAGINIALASKALAFLHSRSFVIPEDVRRVVKDVMRHRILLNYEAEAEGVVVDNVIDQILNRVEVP